jgi:GNAT superfamily N-acetyltransferase
MEVLRAAGPNEFLALSEVLRDREPVRTNVPASVALSIASGRRTYEDQFWWIIRHGADVLGLAMRTPPHGIYLGPCAPGAAGALAAAVRDVDPEVPSVNGPEAAVGEFLAALSKLGDRRHAVAVLREHVQTVEELHVPDVSGECRLAGSGDEDLVVDWGRVFAVDAGIPVWSDDSIRSAVQSGSLYLWTVDSRAVSMAGHAVPVVTPSGSVARVGPVFTPHDERGHGYAAAVTASLTAWLMEQGHHVMLHTDAANPTSNGVYRRLGYHVVDDLTRFELQSV